MLIPTNNKHRLYTQELYQPLIAFNNTVTINTPYALFEAGSRGGSVIQAITVVTNDVSARTLTFYETINGKHYVKDTVSLPAATLYGFDGTNHELNILGQMTGYRLDSAGNRSLYLAPGKTLSVAISLAPASDKTVIIRAYGEHY